MIFDLPTALEFGGRAWAIHTDYRDVLRTLTAFEDPNLTDEEKAYICLHNTYPDLAEIPQKDLQAALDAAIAFIDHGATDDGPSPRTMDWEQDAPLIFPAVNRAAGFEVRSAEYLHWWTFMGFFMEIRDTTFATVLSLRQKKYGKHRKKLEKHEQEFWKNNASICELKTRYTDEELAEQERIRKIIGG